MELVTSFLVLNDAFRTKYEVTNSKIYDAYSNMVYTWRGNIEISNSEMVGSGGPLFIMRDGLRDEGDSYNKVDTDGPTLTVSGTCRLEAYATGAESWYDANNASQLVTTMRGAVETDLFNDAGKTIRWVKKEGKMVPYSKGDENMNQYINVLAVMICSPGNLISGWDKHVLDVRGTTSFGGENEYHMHNDFANIVREKTQKNGANYLLLVQMGNNWLATDLANSINPTVDGITKYFDKAASFGDSVSAEQKQLASYASWDNPQTDILSHFGKWRQLDANNYQNKVCVYLSAGVISHSALAPYFGVILDIGNYQG